MLCSYTLEITIPMQLTILNVKGAACNLLDVFKSIYHGKFQGRALSVKFQNVVTFVSLCETCLTCRVVFHFRWAQGEVYHAIVAPWLFEALYSKAHG